MASKIKLTASQYKVIYITWTILGLIFTIIIEVSSIGVVKDLIEQEFSFNGFPIFTISLLALAILMPANLVLFYMGHFFKSKFITASLKWVPICIVVLFPYYIYTIRDYVSNFYLVLATAFILSYFIVFLMQNSYLASIRNKKNR